MIRTLLAFLFALLRIKCDRPRLKPGAKAMVPGVLRDRLGELYCNKWRHHAGPCECEMPDGAVERWGT